jgi:hypothetical protein
MRRGKKGCIATVVAPLVGRLPTADAGLVAARGRTDLLLRRAHLDQQRDAEQEYQLGAERPVPEPAHDGRSLGPMRLQFVTHIRGRPGIDVVGSPAELQAEVPGRPRKTTGTKRKCG